MARRGKPKRGVLLLVVLSILVIFVLAGLTFIVVASQYERGSIQQAKHQLTGDAPRDLADRGMMQLLRGTDDPVSSLFKQDLLNDLYGNDGFAGFVQAAIPDPRTGGQIVGIDFAVEPDVSRPGFSRPAGYYGGCVITMVSGPANGLSSRVIRSMDIAVNGVLFAEAFVSDQNVVITPRQGDRFIVNGRPFNGTGFGYNPATGRLDQVDNSGNGFRVALLARYNATGPTARDLGGADESYDAVDMQNMFLAKVPPAATSSREITPSFHRPHLVAYWLQQLRTQFGGSLPPQVLQQILGQVVLRPNTFDHPLFTGSNPLFSIDADGDMIPDGLVPSATGPGPGPWDVDNDGDGIPDSIWIDLGMPLATAADGRIYRPLFAFLCTDLDSRVNLNVHGNLAQLDPTYTSLVPTRGVVPGAASDIIVPRGSGYGPPEIDLSALFVGEQRLLMPRVLMQARYVGKTFAGTRDFFPGIAQFDDSLSAMKSVGVPQDFTSQLSAYATPPDLYGRGVTVLDHAGQPVTAFMGQPNETVDDPYELNVVETNATDTPFTAGELERLLRIFDLDASLLPDRIRNLLVNSLQQDPTISRLVTTDSFDLPVPNIQLPPDLRVRLSQRKGLNASPHVVEWITQRLLDNGVLTENIPSQLALMLPFEILHGQKMDINRLWGNGLDDDGNGVVDEDTEPQAQSNASAANVMWAANPAVGNGSGTSVDYTNDYPGVPDETMGRQIFARHLYCMMMMLLEPGYTDPTIRSLPANSPVTQELTAQRIAQWAINVVDFRDDDAIMTPFEYDMNPMNGWQPNIDGDARTDEGGERRIVWGAEYPHLLLTETMAFHDLRLKDSSWDDDPQTKGAKRDQKRDGKDFNPDEEDDDLDQFRIPQGSFFAELFCTFNPNSTQAPQELYTLDPADRRWKLDLARMSPPTASGARYPVWRLAISDSQTDGRSPSVMQRSREEPDLISFQPEKMTSIGPGDIDPADQQVRIDRIVWLTPVPPTGTVVNADKIFWNRMGMPALLPPKHYAVIGPRRLTMIGSKTDQSLSNQSINLLPVRVNRNLAGAGYPRAGVDIQPPIGIIAAMNPPSPQHPTTPWTDWQNTAPEGIGVNVSEPLPTDNDYYPEPRERISDPVRYPVQDAYGIEGMAGRMRDQPFDRPDGVPTRPIERLGGIAEGTIPDYRTVFLQRLANPLLPANPKPGNPAHDPNTPVNPYITVDWLPVDLTIFNGEDRQPVGWPKDEPWSWPEEQPVPGKREGDDGIDFATRQRGVLAPAQADGLNVNHWSAVSTPPVNTVPDPNLVDLYFQHNIEHTLGFLNSTYGPFQSGRGPAYAGDPQRPFPWLTWNDRPYSSHLELMLVPSSSPSRLLFEYSLDQRTNPYDAKGRNPAQFRSPYQHLLNFFHSSNVPTDSPNYQQILELVEVPSRFVGTERWYNPNMFVRNTATTTPLNDPRAGFRPPFNKLSRFRDPGRVNINTIFDPRVWSAVSHGFPAFDSVQFWNLVEQSRRGTSTPFDPNFPTEFANPFRSAAGADLQFELMGMTNVPGVEATLLRSRPGQQGEPLFGYDSQQLYDETDRNPYFRYQGLQRLGNLLTTHSNVFAVWVTVGYFEVVPWPNANGNPQPDPTSPDSLHQIGYQLSQELNSGSGEVKRYRSFYIIDRSIPVAYEPGKNHNVERAILLRRFIE